MKRKNVVPIVWKITLWYTLFLGLLAIIFVSITVIISDRIFDNNARTNLIYRVEDFLEELEYEENHLDYDDDVDFVESGIYLSVYNGQGDLLDGYVPQGFEVDATFHIGLIRTIRALDSKWYLYEQSISLNGYGDVIVRGFMPFTAVRDIQHVMLRVLLISFPILLIVATFGGYSLTRHALNPIYQMRKTVEQISSGEDLTKRVNLGEGEDELHKLAKTFDLMFERLEMAFDRETRFTSDVSHELRTPISVILSQCEYAMSVDNNAETELALTSIHEQTLRMSKMIHQLLELARAKNNHADVDKEMIELSDLLQVILENAQDRASEKDLIINSKIEKDIVMYADETMIVRFFVNLLNNAIQFSHRHGSIDVALYQEDSKVKGYVRDYGIGIAKQDLNKIWDRFYQVAQARTTNRNGSSGLGLSMVKYIARVHGGDVGVISELGHGSTFYFEFALENSDE